ncbi:MAG: cobyrinate a,c-diamide synthase [Desulfobacterales bacterium]|jgi:cobyrinic acid a,c-diamide synthase|nr:cobyrinate a,c-diamide synthase [Desulfobacterales bacterium]
MTRKIPRILIAAAQSGSGKTTLTLGVVSALRRRGLKVQPFKVGPDFLDPTWLTAASGRPCYNLDGWMSGPDYVARLFDRATADADIAVIEGVMGLYDGANASDSAGSSAEIARWLQAPVVLVVNVHGMSRSVAPVVAGFAGFEEGVCIRGVIANHCGSEKHRNILKEALQAAGQPVLVGAVPRGGVPELPSRHLGLVTADSDRNCSPAVLKAFALAAETHLNLDEILTIAGSAPRFQPPSFGPAKKGASPAHSLCLAVARDECFHFYYQDLFDELEHRGCQIDYFSPLRDASLPKKADAVYLGGGYPEAFAETLAANAGMTRSLRQFAQSGRPVYAECGGLIYLSEALTTREGNRRPLLGILPGETRMLNHRKHLGYVEVRQKADALWGKAGTHLRGHEFHYSEVVSNDAIEEKWTTAYDLIPHRGACKSSEGYYQPQGRILASYVHLHLASRPDALDYFLNLCALTRCECP